MTSNEWFGVIDIFKPVTKTLSVSKKSKLKGGGIIEIDYEHLDKILHNNHF